MLEVFSSASILFKYTIYTSGDCTVEAEKVTTIDCLLPKNTILTGVHVGKHGV